MARLVDDAQSETREPSHSDLEFQINRARLTAGDPKAQGQLVGKAKRIRGTLSWALENNPSGGESLVESLLSFLRASGGFRPGALNYAGAEAITNAIAAFRAEGFTLTQDGELQPQILENLSGAALTTALESYIRRAKRGAEDAALLSGTSKDLLEATAAHILVERNGNYPRGANFEGLLGMAFVAIDLATPQHPIQPGEPPQRKVERAMFSLACGVNAMRNKLGTGHGRPWLTNITDTEARAAIQFMGTIAEWLLHAHARKTGL
ncbi:MAG: abortive infection family protein [Limnobacter sp.]|uniref:abortive infection family protein n=1 Tax=Limnobacter sp. TaxID=2003368 RepID=UPI0032EE5330